MEIRKIDVQDEKELQDLLYRNPSAIEEGLIFVAKEVQAHGNRKIDLLGQDRKGQLVIVELKIDAAEDVIVQILDYADFAWRNFRLLFERYSDLDAQQDFDPEEHIRLFVVAGSFTNAFRRIVPHTGWEIEAYRYQGIEVGEKEKALVCVQENIPTVTSYALGKPIDIEHHIDYITDEDAKEATEELVRYISEFDNVEVVPTKRYIAFKRKRNFAGITTRRNYSTLWYREEKSDGWEVQIESIDDIDSELRKSIRKAYELTS